MSDLEEFFNQEWAGSLEAWKMALKKELKTEEIESKTIKKGIDLNAWPTLSLSSSARELPVQVSWKKASQSYIKIPPSLKECLEKDLESGVRCFFFEQEFLTDEIWKEVSHTLSSSPAHQELQVFVLGYEKKNFNGNFPLISESDMVLARDVHEQGGTIVMELARTALQLVQEDKERDHYVFGLFLDSQFFKNIAKVRAMKLLARRILDLKGHQKEFTIVGLTSFREWTLYERMTNLLRNDVAVASGYLGGADFVQSSGYQMIFEKETNVLDKEHQERSYRMARNTSHILALESMLGVVHDPAFGSHHLESLTQYYAQESWALMQKYLQGKAWDSDLTDVRESRLNLLRTRKKVLVGVNDYPDHRERLGNITLKKKIFRVAQEFESLRLEMERIGKAPKVFVAVHGDQAALNARINFVKNYFELLGLEVTEGVENLPDETDIFVLCASDEDYPSFAAKCQNVKAREKFVAGKVNLPGLTAIHAGQDVYQVLKDLTERWRTK